MIKIKVQPEFKEALKMVLDELNAIYRFENDELVMHEPEFKHFLGFMRPIIEFCDTLKQEVEIDD